MTYDDGRNDIRSESDDDVDLTQDDVYCECMNPVYFTTNESGYWICDVCGGYHE